MKFCKYSTRDFVMRHKTIDKSLSFAYLNESGREIFIRSFEENLNTTISL
ncbi:MAG: hypothetical protein RXR65_06995 [Hydrogenobaculum sp.]